MARKFVVVFLGALALIFFAMLLDKWVFAPFVPTVGYRTPHEGSQLEATKSWEATKTSDEQHERYVKEVKEDDARRAKAEADFAETAHRLFLKTKAGAVWKKHPYWDKNDCAVIANHRILVGFTGEQVRAAWGRPEHINSTTTLLGDTEQWVYGSGFYVYIDHGRVTSIQTSH